MKHTGETITETYATVKLRIDAHAKWYSGPWHLDGATPQPGQSNRQMTPSTRAWDKPRYLGQIVVFFDKIGSAPAINRPGQTDTLIVNQP